MCFSESSHCDLDLGHRMLTLDLVQDIVILNISVKIKSKSVKDTFLIA